MMIQDQKNSVLTPTRQHYDIVVVGDEVESILTAVSAARLGISVLLLRASTGQLGGLSTRGGLSYMDITPEYNTGLFKVFTQRAGVIRVALNPERANQVLTDMLSESGVEWLSGVRWASPPKQTEADQYELNIEVCHEAPCTLSSTILIDSTPDASIARQMGLTCLKGLGNLFGADIPFLGISPVFRITGVSVPDLQAFEQKLRQSPDIQNSLEEALPYHPEHLRHNYIERPTFAPEDMDYLDILNPVIGIDYHQWKKQKEAPYSDAPILIDGANISRLSDGSLGFNGMVAQASALNLDFEKLIQLSEGGETPEALLSEMQCFESYLKTRGGFSQARIIPPQELYVRQTVIMLAAYNMTAHDILQGGVSEDEAIGSFSYWLDLRGINLWQYLNGKSFPKPHINLGLRVCLPHNTRFNNLGFVSRSAGYSPLGQGIGRIVQHNAILGEALGVAAALAIIHSTTLRELVIDNVSQVKTILKNRNAGTLLLNGHATMSLKEMGTISLLKKDTDIMLALRAALHPSGI